MLNNINSNIPYTFTTALTQKDMSSMNISLQEYTDEGWRSIYEVPMDGLSDEVTFDYTATSTNNLRLHYSGRTLMYGHVIVKALNVVRKDKLASSSIETLCEVDGDFSNDYRFGFNGQEKVDEIAGVGNHNTALFWEYYTRLGRRWNLDPVETDGVSPYVANLDNPILYNDPNGD
jgi:hypothetical protein